MAASYCRFQKHTPYPRFNLENYLRGWQFDLPEPNLLDHNWVKAVEKDPQSLEKQAHFSFRFGELGRKSQIYLYPFTGKDDRISISIRIPLNHTFRRLTSVFRFPCYPRRHTYRNHFKKSQSLIRKQGLEIAYQIRWYKTPFTDLSQAS